MTRSWREERQLRHSTHFISVSLRGTVAQWDGRRVGANAVDQRKKVGTSSSAVLEHRICMKFERLNVKSGSFPDVFVMPGLNGFEGSGSCHLNTSYHDVPCTLVVFFGSALQFWSGAATLCAGVWDGKTGKRFSKTLSKTVRSIQICSFRHFRPNVLRCFPAGGASCFKAVLWPWLCVVGSSVCGNLGWSGGNSLDQVVCNGNIIYDNIWQCYLHLFKVIMQQLLHPVQLHVCKEMRISRADMSFASCVHDFVKFVGCCISIAAAIMLSDGGIVGEHVLFSDGRMSWIVQDAIIFGELHKF